jgi:hypothetical protein
MNSPTELLTPWSDDLELTLKASFVLAGDGCNL